MRRVALVMFSGFLYNRPCAVLIMFTCEEDKEQLQWCHPQEALHEKEILAMKVTALRLTETVRARIVNAGSASLLTSLLSALHMVCIVSNFWLLRFYPCLRILIVILFLIFQLCNCTLPISKPSRSLPQLCNKVLNIM
jgi:hypothetical protein